MSASHSPCVVTMAKDDDLRSMNKIVGDHLVLNLGYASRKYGQHPHLHMQMVMVDRVATYETILSHAIHETYPKQQWKN